MNTIHVISGLPRSGSTLLAALLRQNPRFSAGVVSPLYGLVVAMLDQMNSGREFSSFFDERRRLSLLRGLFESCYGNRGEGDGVAIFDVWESEEDWNTFAAHLEPLVAAAGIEFKPMIVPMIAFEVA